MPLVNKMKGLMKMANIKLGLQWHITDECDQRCKHCYIYYGKNKNCSKELDVQTLDIILNDFIETCKKMNAEPAIAITGGDPLLYSKFWEFSKILKKKNIKYSILGNPFHLSYDIVKRLENSGCISYQMSLDGLENTHDYIRKNGSFSATINALKYFKNSKIRTIIMSTVSKTNIDEIPQLVDIIVEKKVGNFAFARYCPTFNETELMISPEEYRNFLEEMWKKYMQYKQSETLFALKDHLWKLFLYEKGLFNPNEYINEDDLILDGCHCGISHMTVLSDGTVYACRRSETPIGKVPEQSLYDIFHSKEMDNYRMYEKFEYCSKCELKNFCRGCPSVAKGLTGNFYAKDPQCWKKIY